MAEYKYQSPLDRGFEGFKLTKTEHNRLFTYRQTNWKYKYLYYISDKEFIMERYTSLVMKSLLVLGFPVICLLNGLANYNGLFKEYGDMFYEQERGKFSADSSYVTSKSYKDIKVLLASKRKDT